jgi:outer membrane biosynthesis protein TonB
MEPVHTRKKKNSTRVNLIYSIIFHALVIGVAAYISARSGLFGERVQEIFMASLEKAKKPEEKPPPPKIVEPPKNVEKPQLQPLAAPPVQTAAAPPPPAAGPAAVAPPPADISDALYDPNASKVESSTNAAVDYYKNWVEYTLRSNWERPDDITDDSYVAEIQVSLDPDGRITGTDWVKGSGDARWDASVRAAVASTKTIDRPPPKGFPPRFLVRFDVVAATEPVLQ